METPNFPDSKNPSTATTKPKPKSRPVYPIETAITAWLSLLPPGLLSNITTLLPTLISNTPKRWVVYAPMILLPSGSFDHPSWHQTFTVVTQPTLKELWLLILESIGKREGKGVLTHLAVNSGIPLLNSGENRNRNHQEENILRTPSSIKILYGDFGPVLAPATSPTAQDFKEAFWVQTKQNGITQIWAPRYTMFSRGNVKEKARLLSFHSQDQEKGVGKGDTAVDLYAGIGYFVFSYVGMGMKRVVGWELNPWSVEGLRRGAVANKWSVKVVKRRDEWAIGDERITVFEEDNRRAVERLRGVDLKELGKVRHVNCGLLPTSDMSWEMAQGILSDDGWIHLHENVGVNDVENRKGAIEEIFRGFLIKANKNAEARIDHVEFVKTFAPGVWHCVFDIYVTS